MLNALPWWNQKCNKKYVQLKKNNDLMEEENSEWQWDQMQASISPYEEKKIQYELSNAWHFI